MLDDVAMNLRLQVIGLRLIMIWAKADNEVVVISDIIGPRSSKNKKCLH
ncbi:MAG: hypothetical protein U1C47_14195 [Hydrogenophaga sp.]|jgi:hypothetical protein|nr:MULTISPECIES: hypothetical protein [Hydrogenophaga]MBU4183402.1 hypothetical protein [Gammaproteobacteria bacterium]MBU4281950.1 hypothetical protein [Gammaproteobacteria bacterium]MBU4322224.1 hypothetical protein [Gammaproteobacteria bacterium]MCG2658421.1 hypothetical protein [Hydrogenophaga sp.]MDZ4293065.1 hypothetical protein [Hydrogenophaga sp.]